MRDYIEAMLQVAARDAVDRRRAARDLRARRRRALRRAGAGARPPAHARRGGRRARVRAGAVSRRRRPARRRAARPSGVSGALDWLRRWGISIWSLVAGVFTLFVFRRGLPNVALIVGYLLLLWLLVAVLVQVRGTLAGLRAARAPLGAHRHRVLDPDALPRRAALPAARLLGGHHADLAERAVLRPAGGAGAAGDVRPVVPGARASLSLGRQRLLPRLDVRRAEPGPAAGRASRRSARCRSRPGRRWWR